MSADGAAAFESLAADLEADGFATGKMFGLPCLKYGGKAVVALKDDGAAFKLGKDTAEHEAALKQDGAELFDPAGRGVPMKDWVWLPPTQAASWPDHAKTAGSRVGG
ncbi:hypothetical protein [Actinomadura sp. 3N407]|uniref:hypothetical protein n=1 Tax=Actinomadura sp. 3N407 TaxID=3457423 RepID=UPI003FCC65B4